MHAFSFSYSVHHIFKKRLVFLLFVARRWEKRLIPFLQFEVRKYEKTFHSSLDERSRLVFMFPLFFFFKIRPLEAFGNKRAPNSTYILLIVTVLFGTYEIEMVVTREKTLSISLF